tara:strand:+ start:1352 stop:2458 length:1107 start_codon:yes stop_codon:yes gene_type:complete
VNKKEKDQRKHDNMLVWAGFLFLITLVVSISIKANAQSTQQSGTACVNGTQYCENSNVYTTNQTTTNNSNQNTNQNTNNTTTNNTNNSVSQNTNINQSTATNNNVSSSTNVNTNVSTSTSSATSQNTNINTSTSTVNSTVNQTVNNNNVSQSTSNSVSQNTNINKSESESKVETSNLNQNMNNTVSDNTNRNINQSSSTQTIRQEIKSEAPPASAIAPSIMSYSQDLCTTGVSGAFQGQVFGLSGGKSVRDMNCERLKLSKYLYDMGMKVAAISLLAQDERVFKAMWQAGTPAPYEGKIGAEAKELWLANPQKRPDKADFEDEFVESCTQERNPKRDKINKDVVGAVKVIYTRKTKSKKQCKKELYGG